jgi:sugar/nucleoside kinase (ribokinase family)
MQPDGILGIGVCTLDVISMVESFPANEGVEMARESICMGGGPVATALAAAAALGSRTTMLDRLGDDWRSRQILAELKGLAVGVQHIVIQAGAEASLATVLVRASDGARAIRFVRSTSAALTPKEIGADLVLSHRIVHTNGRHPDACLAAAELCASSGGTTRLAFDGGAGRYRDDLLPLMAKAELPIVALDFATKSTGCSEPETAAERLAKLCPKAQLIGITDGDRGSWIFPKDGDAFHQPAYPANPVVDTTGCGDVYHGAFLHALDRGLDLRAAAELASKAGARAATALGGRGALPEREGGAPSSPQIP